jgi:hypothetical protein
MRLAEKGKVVSGLARIPRVTSATRCRLPLSAGVTVW